MTDPAATLYFDFVDPLSYLLELQLESEGLSTRVARSPLELIPPPEPIVRPTDSPVADAWSDARAAGRELMPDLAPTSFVPWTRKAHELCLFAETQEAGDTVRRAVFDAYMLAGTDIGRVDVLVEIAGGLGLDRTETKVVLDVDRYDEAVTEARQRAIGAGVLRPPVLIRGPDRLEGFHYGSALRTFLGDS